MSLASESPVIDVKGITKSFDGRVVVDHIDMQVNKGEVYGFLGPNGSGKTTFIRMLCGLLKLDHGEGHCLGYDIVKQSSEVKKHVGYMTQRFSLYEDLSVEENLNFTARIYGIEDPNKKIQMILEEMELKPRRAQLAGSLSGGWKQRLSLAACMLHKPDLLLLDEPTAGVDPKARREFWEEIHELAAKGLTVLVTTHYMDEAERCHKLAYIAYGKLLVSGRPEEVIKHVGLSTWEISGSNIMDIIHVLKTSKLIEQVTAFGNTLHVSGKDKATIEGLLGSSLPKNYNYREIETGLEDAFINLMHHEEEKS
ncbi:MAG: ABC transporter ATP-binding protein [SAR324 cluster bacterium]|uniref:ABC transporter ATP-binding protein n=1 Tax=SAR324 cluster bacterium TaxID=2024889 RepID=A0A7X9IK25_9DELT|nr:ABC transporter ATP-binding protein [SAR324 cluster bacterium]